MCKKQRGKRPYFYKEKTVGRVGVDLCAKAVEDAWKDPAFLEEQDAQSHGYCSY